MKKLASTANDQVVETVAKWAKNDGSYLSLCILNQAITKNVNDKNEEQARKNGENGFTAIIGAEDNCKTLFVKF